MNKTVVHRTTKSSIKKYSILLMCIVFDIVGMLSFSLPFIGEYTDVIWAPISSLILYAMFRGDIGKIGGLVSFLEEILPGLDVIPTFTLMWIYKFYLSKQKAR
ncbi:hypothetical protein MWU59_09810 [Flavobacteriaceae bacterium F08102]|nr:hypothetical protein [Flavobacteriaceae bacterium F08102]